MKKISKLSLSIMLAFVCAFAFGCKDACDELEDVCDDCSNSDYKTSCDDSLSVCKITIGKAKEDCCEALLDDYKENCK